ncbi:MAG: hypothetical protein ABIE36_02710 [Candidatus Diapherotrites archaeon]
MNKKGFLLAEETLKILVALVCLVFLIFLVISLYNSATKDKKLEYAKADLSQIYDIISTLKEGETKSQILPNPEGWHLYSFVESEKPNSCIGDNCLCICDNVFIRLISSQAEKCNKKGTCLIVSDLAKGNLDIKIKNPTFLRIRKQSGKIFIGETNEL